MSKPITSFVGLDVHQDSTAIGVAEAGREAPRFLGTVGPDMTQLLKALKSLGKPNSLLVVYEAGPCGYGSELSCRWSPLARAQQLTAQPLLVQGDPLIGR